VVLGSRFIAVTGRLQHESGVIHVVAQRLEDRTGWLADLSAEATGMESLSRTQAHAAGAIGQAAAETHAVMPKGRNFQ
jgi:error-prone DNA polymerase